MATCGIGAGGRWRVGEGGPPVRARCRARSARAHARGAPGALRCVLTNPTLTLALALALALALTLTLTLTLTLP